jgi:hypothetical protein
MTHPRALTCLAALAAAILAPASAEAAVDSSGGFKYVTVTKQLKLGQPKVFKASCPQGTHVYGGGHYNNRGFGTVLPSHSYPDDSGDAGGKPDDGWKARVGGDGKRTRISVYAICARPAPVYRQNTFNAPGGTATNTDVDCPPDTTALSGGTSGPAAVPETKASPNLIFGVNLTVDNYTLESRELKGFAICSARAVTSEFGSGGVNEQSQGSVGVSCPATLRVVGGGYSHNGSYPNLVPVSSEPQGFTQPGIHRWTIWYDNYNPTMGHSITSYASCMAPLN